jgi:hypothetical protein
MLDSPERVCAGQAQFEYPATSVLFSNYQTEAARYQAGIQNVTGVHNTFNEVNIWDVPGGNPLMTIGPTADRTLIIGGILAGEPGVIVDQGRATKIV